MQHQFIGMHRPCRDAYGAGDATVLDEVDFKWLMAGHGWWVDRARLRTDAAYADGLLQFATASDSAALRACADRLRRHWSEPAERGVTTNGGQDDKAGEFSTWNQVAPLHVGPVLAGGGVAGVSSHCVVCGG